MSPSDNNQADVVQAFNSTSIYLDDLLYIDNPYFERMVSQIYPTKPKLSKENSYDTEDPFLDLDLPITNDIVSCKIYDKWDGFKFEMINFSFLAKEFLAPLPVLYPFRSLFVLREDVLNSSCNVFRTLFSQ